MLCFLSPVRVKKALSTLPFSAREGLGNIQIKPRAERVISAIRAVSLDG